MAEYKDLLEGLAHILARLGTTEPGLDVERLAEATGLLPKTLDALRFGAELLSWEVTCAYVTACGGDKDEVREAWEAVNDAQTAPEDHRRWRTVGDGGRIGKWARHDTVGVLPSSAGARNLKELAERLMQLKAWAGGPALKELEKRSHRRVNDSTLSEIFNRRPDLLTPDRAEQITCACGLPPWEAISWREAAAGLSRLAVHHGADVPVTAGHVNLPVPDPPSPLGGDRPRKWSRRREVALLMLVIALAVLYGRTLLISAPEYYYLQVVSPTASQVVHLGEPIVFPFDLPSEQDWYLDVRFRLGWTEPGLSVCKQNAEVTYYATTADGQELTRSARIAPAAVSAVKSEPLDTAHLGKVGGRLNVIVKVTSNDSCELTLDLSGTAVRTHK